jgi:hypothetical protein
MAAILSVGSGLPDPNSNRVAVRSSGDTLLGACDLSRSAPMPFSHRWAFLPVQGAGSFQAQPLFHNNNS